MPYCVLLLAQYNNAISNLNVGSSALAAAAFAPGSQLSIIVSELSIKQNINLPPFLEEITVTFQKEINCLSTNTQNGKEKSCDSLFCSTL